MGLGALPGVARLRLVPLVGGDTQRMLQPPGLWFGASSSGQTLETQASVGFGTVPRGRLVREGWKPGGQSFIESL